MRTVRETAREIPVVDEVDVLVIGGGPSGVAAATAAARLGAKTMLVERYGCLGGLATGGLVLHFMHIFDHDGRRWIGGLPWETVERLSSMDGVRYEAPGRPHVDSELLKAVADDICLEAGVELLFHSWAVRPIVEDTRVTGVVVEGKSGSQAILAQVCVDATGDGDIAAGAGAAYEMGNSRIGLPLKVGGVDMEALRSFQKENPQEMEDLIAEVRSIGGFRIRPRPTPYSDDGIHWVNISGLTSRDDARLSGPQGGSSPNPHLNPLDTRDLSFAEVELRRRTLASLDFYRRHVPGFAGVSLLAFASQLGVRDSRHIKGGHTLSRGDVVAGRRFDDAVGSSAVWFSDPGHYQIPYSTLVPEGIEGLLVAGRCISVDHWIINSVRLIPPAMVSGQAAGTAAAMATRRGVEPKDLPIDSLRLQLAEDGVILDAPVLPGGG